jgi:aminoglycoside 6'-N-acetyltransferase I
VVDADAPGVRVRPLAARDRDEWRRLRCALWPAQPLEQTEREMDEIVALGDRAPAFVADRGGRLGGLIELSLRETAPGCATSPVAFVEAWYVDPELRRRGIGRRLMAAGEAWARRLGCREMASDTDEGYPISPAAHAAVGFGTTPTLFTFRKGL